MLHPMRSSPDILKLDLFDPEALLNLCVNPHEVNPQSNHLDTFSQSTAVQSNAVCQDSSSAMRLSDGETGGVFYAPHAPKLKLEMEIFGDLTSYCQSNNMMAATSPQNAVDELNTPVFDVKAPFDFDRHGIGLLDIVTHAEYPINSKIKIEQSEHQSVNIENNNIIINEDILAYKEGVDEDILNTSSATNDMNNALNECVVINSRGLDTSVIFPLNQESDQINFDHESKQLTPVMLKPVVDDEVNFIIVDNCDGFPNSNYSDYYDGSNSHYTDITSNRYADLKSAPFETPETSRSGSDNSGHCSPNLTLSISDKFKAADSINTPDVIQTIDAFETANDFNLLNYVNAQEIETASDVLSSLDVSSSLAQSRSVPPKINTKGIIVGKCPRQRKPNDDDSDYVPPTKKRAAGRKTIKIKAKSPIVYDSDSSDDDFMAVRRGRPRKRNISISSDEFQGADGTKYRVMRDKNNEASRKSRLKRKIKEMGLEKEGDNLEERNRKLRAEVAELEKTVTSFRTNLMKILLTK